MFYNLKNEKIYHPTVVQGIAPMNIYLAGISLPNPDYIIMHNTSQETTHHRYQFEYVVSGKGYIVTDGKTTAITGGDFFFLRKSRKRIYYSDKDDPMKKYFVTVDGPLIDGIVDAYGMTESLIIAKADVKQNFINIMEILDKSDNDYNTALEKVAMEILAIVQKINRGKKNATMLRNADRAENIVHYINQNLYRNFTLNDISNYFFLSKTQILRIFENKYHTTPMKYVTLKRIEMASYYLAESTIPISTISDMLSFNDSKYFSKVFKKYQNQTPSEYRRDKHNEYKQTEKALSKLVKNIKL